MEWESNPFREAYLKDTGGITLEKTSEEKDKEREIFDKLSALNPQDETMIYAKILYDYIDPQSVHGQKDLFLNLFIKNVLGLNLEKLGNIISAERKDIAEKDRRMDFIIESDLYLIGSKMTIFAGDQDIVPEDCYKELEKRNKGQNKTIILYYITHNGRLPKPESLGNHSINIVPLAIKNQIINWLELCQAEVKNNTFIYEHLANYLFFMFAITGQFERLPPLREVS